MAKQAPLPPCEMCWQPSAQVTLVYFGMGEGYDLCPACLTLKNAFEALIKEINEGRMRDAGIWEKAIALLGAIGKRCGSAGIEFFREKFAEDADYDVEIESGTPKGGE